jgi:hypothetical protein
MLQAQNADDPLATLEPRSPLQTEKRAQIEARRATIYAAKDRGCTWEAIAEALAEAGIVITPNALRLAITREPRDLKKYPRKLVGRRQKRQGQQSTVSRGKMQGGNADEERDENRSVVKSEESTNAPASIPPRIDPNSFAGIRRRNMKI